MKTYLIKTIHLAFIVVGASTVWFGLTEFNDATVWLQFLRGLFWMMVGLFCIAVNVWSLKEQHHDHK